MTVNWLSSSSNLDNVTIRKHIITLRKQLSNRAIKTASVLLYKNIQSLALNFNYKKVATYLALNGEIDSQAIINTLHSNNQSVYLPVINKDYLEFAPFNKNTPLIKNKFNILEPKSETISMEQMDIVFMPLVAFKKDANRLGMGGGYYDKTIAKIKIEHRPLLIGLAYEFQNNEHIQVYDWDIQLDIIVTDKNIYFKKSA